MKLPEEAQALALQIKNTLAAWDVFSVRMSGDRLPELYVTAILSGNNQGMPRNIQGGNAREHAGNFRDELLAALGSAVALIQDMTDFPILNIGVFHTMFLKVLALKCIITTVSII
jgi:hypothetical protein